MYPLNNSKSLFSSRGLYEFCKDKIKTGSGRFIAGFSVPLLVPTLMTTLCSMLLLLDFAGLPGSGPTAAFGANFEYKPIDQIITDADEQPLRLPHALFFDKTAGEVYVVTGGKRQIIIYSKDYYPLISFRTGRGVYKPQGIYVDHAGMIYLCQAADEKKPNRISVFNGAFILVREIVLDGIPGVPDFPPLRVVVNREGVIYVTSSNHRGVLVLDRDGKFLRWLRPEDEINYKWNLDQLIEENFEIDAATGPGEDQSEMDDQAVGDIPEEFRPKTKSAKDPVLDLEYGPIMILALNIDEKGRLYLMSNETNKIYVYDSDETFLFSFGEKGGAPRMLSNPRGLAIDDDRRMIYVVDYMRHTILVYDQDTGKYLFEFGGKGVAPGWFNNPMDVAVDQSGNVLVADVFNDRVQVLKVEYERDLPVSEQPEQPAPATTPDSMEDDSSVGESGHSDDDAGPDETIEEESTLSEPSGTTDEEIIFEEEVIEKTIPGQLPVGSDDKEPLDTRSQERGD